ncbi:MAG: hypothetical protein HYY06_20850 [Deltaproteobacteria bacterium]|nr:hypothetical protein [Deltaproteobacteria bacterium]
MRWTILLAAWLATAGASADRRPLVTIAVDGPGDPVAARLRAELEALGFEVEVLEAPSLVPSRPLLEAAARDRGAIAAVRIVPSQAGVEVWVFDRVTGKTVLREVVTDPDPARPDFELIALRAVELLRASLMEVEAPHPSRGEVRPGPVVRAIAERREAPTRQPSMRLALGPGIALSPGGVGPALDVLFEVRFEPAGSIGATVTALVPTLPANVTDEDKGSASVLVALLGADVSWRSRSAWRLEPTAGAGAAMALLHMRGSAAGGYVGATDDTLSLVPYVRGGARLTLWRGLGLVAQTLVGVAIPRPSIRFAGTEVAQWGGPLVVGSLALEVALP